MKRFLWLAALCAALLSVSCKQTLPPEEDPKVNCLLEMPELADGLVLHSQSFFYSGRMKRNYAYGWDSDAHLAHWVAYPLCGLYTMKNVSRGDNWAYDPQIPESEQASKFSGYDRGHQIPSADRLCCTQANDQTFYYSNMTPQKAVFNQEIWNEFEQSVRVWASSCDTLYVVTGCDVQGVTARNNGTLIPKGYYKALLGYKRGSKWGDYFAMGFYFEHRTDYGQPYEWKSFAMSIKDLETLLGENFFVSLPLVVGEQKAAEIEAAKPADGKWWL